MEAEGNRSLGDFAAAKRESEGLKSRVAELEEALSDEDTLAKRREAR